MNESPELHTTAIELRLDRWGFALLGQKPDYTDFDKNKAFDSIPRTDITAAAAIEKMLEGRLSYVSTEDRWYLWDGRVHKPCNGDTIALQIVQLFYSAMVEAIQFVKSWYDLQAQMAANSGAASAKEDAAAWKAEYNKGEITKHKRYRDDLAKYYGMNSLVKVLKTFLDVPADKFADDRRWFVIRDGVYDMEAVRRDKRFDLLPHDPARPVFRYWDIEEKPGTPFPALLKFLNGSIADAGQARFFSKTVAYACMGAPVKTKVIVSLQGAPNSGKSMINRAMQRLGGDFFTEPNPSAIVAGGRNPDHARHPMRLARFIGFTEVTERLDRAFVLKYTGGDEITSEQKYVNASAWRPQGIIFMASNYGMDVDRSDAAMYSRLYPVEFPHSFDKANPQFQEDENLEDQIVAQSSGFLEWLKASYLAFLEEGLDRTDSMEALRRAEAAEDDYSIDRYIQDRLESGFFTENSQAKASDCVGVTTAFLDYQGWCDAFRVPKHSQLGRGRFSKEMQKTYPTVTYQTMRFAGLMTKV